MGMKIGKIMALVAIAVVSLTASANADYVLNFDGTSSSVGELSIITNGTGGDLDSTAGVADKGIIAIIANNGTAVIDHYGEVTNSSFGASTALWMTEATGYNGWVGTIGGGLEERR